MNSKHRYETKKYLHFDKRISFYNKVKDYVTNPKEIKRHSFFPLIHYVKKSEKYNKTAKTKRPVKTKKRHIMYASHLDNFIYKYYGDELNKRYNEWAEKKQIDHCSIAYRYKEGEKGKSNINFAADVMNFIWKSKECFIMVGDFEHFFETLNHSLLKRRICEILEVRGLSDDWYQVFKSITKYSYYNKKLLNQQLGTDKEIRQMGQLEYFKDGREFREFRKKYKPIKNKHTFGIPQGTALSAVFSNVYTIDFDVLVNDLIKKYNGIYRRYSDDFIIIIPKSNQKNINLDDFREIESRIYEFTNKSKLSIQKSKTKMYDFTHETVTNIDTMKTSTIDYLGFVFDGKNVKMRGKSPYKFYRHAYKLIDKAKKVQHKKKLKKMPYRKQLYGLYTDMGIKRRPYGNFITYAINAQKIFDEVSPHTNNLMMQQIKNRKKKVEKKLGVKLSFKY